MRDKDDLARKLKFIIEAAQSVLIDVKDQPNIDAKKFVEEQDALYSKGRRVKEANERYDFMDALGDVYHILNKAKKC